MSVVQEIRVYMIIEQVDGHFIFLYLLDYKSNCYSNAVDELGDIKSIVKKRETTISLVRLLEVYKIPSSSFMLQCLPNKYFYEK